MNVKKIGKVFTSKFVGTGPSSYEKIKKIAASSMLHEAKIAYYAFDAAILFATTIGPAVAKAT